jgi:hypothetical protein
VRGVRILLPILALAAVALAACGGGGGSSGQSAEQRAAATTLETWLGAMAAGEDRRACDGLTVGLQRLIDQQLRQRAIHATCRTYAARWTSGVRVPGHKGANVTEVLISGARATATLTAPPDLESEVRLQKVDGRWKVANY